MLNIKTKTNPPVALFVSFLQFRLHQDDKFYSFIAFFLFDLFQIWVSFCCINRYLPQAQNHVLCLPYRIPDTAISSLNCCSCHCCSWILSELPSSSPPLVFSFYLFLIYNFLSVKLSVSSWSVLSWLCHWPASLSSISVTSQFSLCLIWEKSISFHAFF